MRQPMLLLFTSVLFSACSAPIAALPTPAPTAPFAATAAPASIAVAVPTAAATITPAPTTTAIAALASLPPTPNANPTTHDGAGDSALYGMNVNSSNQRLLTTIGSGGARWLAVPTTRATPPADKQILIGSIAVVVKRVGTATTDLYLFTLSKQTPTRISSNPANDYAPAWSPDGSKLAFLSDRDGGPSVYITNSKGNTLKRVRRSTREAPITSVAWSPDGTQLVYDRNCSLETVRSDGSGRTTLLSPADGQDACFTTPSYAPDGKLIVFSATIDSNRSAIFTIAPGGGPPTQLTTYSLKAGSEQHPVFSPDGTHLAFVSYREDAPHIYVANADGTNPRRLSVINHEENWPSWSPDSRWIACEATWDNGKYVDIFPADQTTVSNDTVLSVDTLPMSAPAYGDNSQPAWRPR